MARRYKFFQPDRIYFITFSIFGRKNVFTEEKYFDLIYKWFDYIRSEYDNKIYAYAIMPNHVHAMIFVSARSPKLSILIMNAKRFLAYKIIEYLTAGGKTDLLDFFSANARRADRARHRVFSDRYDSLPISSDKVCLQKLNYIHNNPCQEHWRLALNPEDYPYSSASNYARGRGAYNNVDMLF